MKRILSVGLTVSVLLVPTIGVALTVEQTAGLPTSAQAGDHFGTAVAIDGGTAVVGAPGDDDNGDASGTAYVFIRTGDVWTQQAVLQPTDGSSGYLFGRSVDLDGDTAVVGAPSSVPDQGYGETVVGSAYVFTRAGDVWTEQAKLVPSSGVAGNLFGRSVAIDGDTALIGAFLDAAPFAGQGSAYVFTRTGGAWVEQAKLLPADGGWFDEQFGYAVALDGDTAVVGASGSEVPEPGPQVPGTAYVFTREAGVWTQQAEVQSPDGGTGPDLFAHSVAVDSDTALFGEIEDYDSGDFSGAVHPFTRVDEAWTAGAPLFPSDGSPDDNFGWSVALDGVTAVVGANHHDDHGAGTGTAYVFTRSGEDWTEQAELQPPDAAYVFGASVSLDGDTALIGAWGSDSAYVFARAGDEWTVQATLDPIDDDPPPADDVPATGLVGTLLVLFGVAGIGVYLKYRIAT